MLHTTVAGRVIVGIAVATLVAILICVVVQAEQVEETGAELDAATQSTLATADSLAALDERIDAAATLVGGYAERATEASLLVDRQRDALDSTARRARLPIIAFGVVFGVGQFAPLYLGVALTRGTVPTPHDRQPARGSSAASDDA